MRIVHLGTLIQTVFAVVDGDGNVVRRHPVQLQIDVLDELPFIEAYNALREARDSLRAQLDGQVPVVPVVLEGLGDATGD